MKFKRRIIIVIIVIVSFGLGMKYSTVKKYNRDKKYYLNQMYFEINFTISAITSMKYAINDINQEKDTANPFKDIVERINLMKNTCDEGYYYMLDTDNIYILDFLSDSFELIKIGIESGIVLNDERICYGFWDDKVISENEMLFLDSFQKELESIRDNICNEKTNVIEVELSMEEFDKISRGFTWRYSTSNIHSIGLKN
jgi:hypothetical protein